MTRAHKMGKTESAQCHKSNKVPLDEDAKSVVVKDSKKSNVKKLSICGNCKQFGHTRAQCVMPPNSKLRSTLTFHLTCTIIQEKSLDYSLFNTTIENQTTNLIK